MEKIINIVKKGEDEGNLKFALSLSFRERLEYLEKIREEVIKEKYGTKPRFQRVLRIVKKK